MPIYCVVLDYCTGSDLSATGVIGDYVDSFCDGDDERHLWAMASSYNETSDALGFRPSIVRYDAS